MSIQDKSVLGEEAINALKNVLPQLNGLNLHPQTRFQVYMESKAKTMEYTVFYREPERTKKRIDFEVDSTSFIYKFAFGPEDVTITYWGSAVRRLGLD